MLSACASACVGMVQGPDWERLLKVGLVLVLVACFLSRARDNTKHLEHDFTCFCTGTSSVSSSHRRVVR